MVGKQGKVYFHHLMGQNTVPGVQQDVGKLSGVIFHGSCPRGGFVGAGELQKRLQDFFQVEKLRESLRTSQNMSVCNQIQEITTQGPRVLCKDPKISLLLYLQPIERPALCWLS